MCKYYPQGNCRYGQYCQFKHVNTFGNNYNEDEITAFVVAHEVFTAERSGQWLLSCFAPFKERPCIPGMEDLSPEEVRWEMYQAQQNGVVEQAKLRFQQLCQDMKTKRDALKNPTPETLDMLKKISGNGQKSGIGNSASTKPSKFSFASSLNIPSSTSTSAIFGNKLFTNQNNTFGRSFVSSNIPSLFTRVNNSVPLFGANPTFSNNMTFPNGTNSGSVFGNNTNASVFGNGQTNQTFATIAPQTNSIFGGSTSQAVFGQSSNFTATTQANNVFARPSTSQTTTSVFDNGTTSSNPLFYTPQSNASLFGKNKSSTNGPFGESSAIQTSNSIFGSTTSSGNLSSNSTSVFGQPKTTAAFGGAPVFGASGTFANNPTPSIFGGQTFKDSQVPGDNIFNRLTTPSNFGAVSQATNVFSVTTSTSTLGVYGTSQNTPPIILASNATPFVSTAPTTCISFGTVNSQVDSKDIHVTARPTFGVTNTSSPLNTTVTSSTVQFGPATGTTFSGTKNTSPFAVSTFNTFTSSVMPTNTTVTNITTNPFVSQQANSPFNDVIRNQNNAVNESLVSNQSTDKTLFTFALKNTVIDHTVYSEEVHLTDDEKNMYLADHFIIGKIPLKPPCESMR